MKITKNKHISSLKIQYFVEYIYICMYVDDITPSQRTLLINCTLMHENHLRKELKTRKIISFFKII